MGAGLRRERGGVGGRGEGAKFSPGRGVECQMAQMSVSRLSHTRVARLAQCPHSLL